MATIELNKDNFEQVVTGGDTESVRKDIAARSGGEEA